jgi:hypothetical protein
MIKRFFGLFRRDPSEEVAGDWPYDHYDRPVGFGPRWQEPSRADSKPPAKE